jgi:hypothetical protein
MPALVWAADTVSVGGHDFVNKGLVGVGRFSAALRDQHGETVGSGSGLGADLKSWQPWFSSSLARRNWLYLRNFRTTQIEQRPHHYCNHGSMRGTGVSCDICLDMSDKDNVC